MDSYRCHVWRRSQGIWRCLTREVESMNGVAFRARLGKRSAHLRCAICKQNKFYVNGKLKKSRTAKFGGSGNGLFEYVFSLFTVPRIQHAKIHIRKYPQIRSRFLCWKLSQSHQQWQQSRMLQVILSKLQKVVKLSVFVLNDAWNWRPCILLTSLPAVISTSLRPGTVFWHPLKSKSFTVDYSQDRTFSIYRLGQSSVCRVQLAKLKRIRAAQDSLALAKTMDGSPWKIPITGH